MKKTIKSLEKRIRELEARVEYEASHRAIVQSISDEINHRIHRIEEMCKAEVTLVNDAIERLRSISEFRSQLHVEVIRLREKISQATIDTKQEIKSSLYVSTHAVVKLSECCHGTKNCNGIGDKHWCKS